MFVNFGLVDTDKAPSEPYGVGYEVYIGKQRSGWGGAIDSLKGLALTYRKPGKLIGFLNPTEAKDFYYKFKEWLVLGNRGKPKYKQNKINKRYSTKDPDFRNVLGMIDEVKKCRKTEPYDYYGGYYEMQNRKREWGRCYQDVYIRLLWTMATGLKWGVPVQKHYALTFIPVVKRPPDTFITRLESLDLESYGL